MDNVIQFPGLDKRAWREVEEELTNFHHPDQRVKECFSNAFLGLIKKCSEARSYSCKTKLPGDLTKEQTEKVTEEIQRMTGLYGKHLLKQYLLTIVPTVLSGCEYKCGYRTPKS